MSQSGMILLDTHILIRLLLDPNSLKPATRKAIAEARKTGPLAISAISLWKIAWLVKNGRIETAASVETFVRRCASFVQVLPITPEIAVRSVGFPDSYPHDPQDRIIGATALAEGIRLLTYDELIRKSGLVPLVR